MKVFHQIKQLLYRYDCVILPGFGAFITRGHSAVLKADGTLIPPGKSVFFNRQLQTNDGLLAHHLAHTEGITYELALEKIRLFSERLLTDLKQGKIIDCSPLGHFEVQENGVMRFDPIDRLNLAAQSFGLKPVIARNIDRAIKEETPVIPIQNYRDLSRTIWRYAAVGLIAVSLGGYAATYLYNQSITEYNQAIEHQAQAYVLEQIQEATFTPSIKPTVISIPVQPEQGPYHLMAGAFRVAENAKRQVIYLKTKGYSARIIGQNKFGLHQVVFASYEEREKALHALKKIRAIENPEAWLLVQ